MIFKQDILVPGTGIYQGPGILFPGKIKNIINSHHQYISKKYFSRS